MATATAAAVEATGTRRAVKSERFMEWQRELTSSRAIHGGRKRHEETDMETVAAVGAKKSFIKSDEDGAAKPQGGGNGSNSGGGDQESDEREAEGEEPAGESVIGEEGSGAAASHRIRKQKQLHQRQRSDVVGKKFRKENEVDQKRVSQAQQQQGMEKSPPRNNSPPEGDGGRMRRCKQQQQQQQQQQDSQALQQQQASNHHSRRQAQSQSQSQSQSQLVTPLQPQPETSLSQPTSRRRQRRVPRSISPQKEEKDIERVLRSITRTRGGETPPPAPAVPPGKGTKRSKRVALRLANEEPPPPPLKLPKLHLVLTRKEIQEDWIKITGHKYSGKPKKSTIVQRGLGLCTSLTCPSSIRYLNEPQCKCSSAEPFFPHLPLELLAQPDLSCDDDDWYREEEKSQLKTRV